MQFNLPTTKPLMYAILKELYKNYRLQSPVYKEDTLIEMTIPTLPVVNKTIDQCEEEARLYLSAEHTREVEKVKSEMADKILSFELAIEKINEEKVEKRNQIESEYQSRFKQEENDAIEKGISASSFMIDKRKKVADEKTDKIVEMERYYDFRVSQIEAEKSIVQQRLLEVDEYYAPIHQKEVDALSSKLYKEYQAQKLEVEKHNNAVYERNVKYKNVIIQNKASLELKFMEVRREYTTSELIERGYYEDVLRCIFGYYDTLDVAEAYADVLYEKDLMYYLDSYYESVLKLFYQRTISAS